MTLRDTQMVRDQKKFENHCSKGFLFSGAGISKLDSMTDAQGVCEDMTKIISRQYALHIMYTVTNITQ